MQRAALERLEFAPPPNKASLRALALALVIHLLLIAALTWGISWKYSNEGGTSFEAELWSASAQQAAPEAPPEPSPRPAPTPTPIPTPEIKPALATHDADIALELEKKRLPAKKPPEKLPEKPPEKQHADLQAEQKRQAKALEKENLAAAAEAEKRHQEDVKRIIGMAGSGAAASSNSSSSGGNGTSTASKGPSAGYASKVVARILPNVVFTDEITGNPQADVEVRSTADGTIMSQRLIKSSGNKDWDEAVIKAIIRTGSLPRDVDGRVPSPMIIQFKPN